MTDAEKNPIINEHYASLETIKRTKRNRIIGQKVGGTQLQDPAASREGAGKASFWAFKAEEKGYVTKSSNEVETRDNIKISAQDLDKQAEEHGKYTKAQRAMINGSVRIAG